MYTYTPPCQVHAHLSICQASCTSHVGIYGYPVGCGWGMLDTLPGLSPAPSIVCAWVQKMLQATHCLQPSSKATCTHQWPLVVIVIIPAPGWGQIKAEWMVGREIQGMGNSEKHMYRLAARMWQLLYANRSVHIENDMHRGSGTATNSPKQHGLNCACL